MHHQRQQICVLPCRGCWSTSLPTAVCAWPGGSSQRVICQSRRDAERLEQKICTGCTGEVQEVWLTVVMPAQDTISATHTTSVDSKEALQRLSLQQSGEDLSSQPCKTKAEVKAGLCLTAASSLPETPALAACVSPRLHPRSGKSGSHVILNVQCGKSPFAQHSVRRLSEDKVLRKSADAVLFTAKSNGNPKAAALKQPRQRSGLLKSTDNAAMSHNDISVAVRRSRVLLSTSFSIQY